MRTSHYWGMAHAAVVVEKRKGKVSFVEIGDVSHTLIQDEGGEIHTKKFHPMRAIGGPEGEYLAASLHDFKLRYSKGDISHGTYAALVDGAIAGEDGRA